MENLELFASYKSCDGKFEATYIPSSMSKTQMQAYVYENILNGNTITISIQNHVEDMLRCFSNLSKKMTLSTQTTIGELVDIYNAIDKDYDLIISFYKPKRFYNELNYERIFG